MKWEREASAGRTGLWDEAGVRVRLEEARVVWEAELEAAKPEVRPDAGTERALQLCEEMLRAKAGEVERGG